ncbi:MAG: phosphotransferase [Candidatus Eremiobacteraeota bacterium]|nr:phosphotransferase [Candidatus Eremiobacteraeota bacterium]MBV8584059.1 phosphotransferase [Candidatus Eremiobacteraeota bacterium]
MPWSADFDVTLDLARFLLSAQFPQFANAPIEPFGEGWDNAAFLVDGTYVFRFPRRSIAVPLIVREIAILPRIASQLPVPISAPSLAGTPGGDYPWPFAGYRRLRGATLSSLHLDASAYERVAGELGRFLRALHAIDARPLLAAGLETDDFGRLDHAKRGPKARARLAELHDAGLVADVRPYLDVLDSIAPAGVREHRLGLVHGDLYAKHVVIDDGRIAGVIDWGDVHFGDPAVDLAIAFGALPGAARATFATAYGGIGPETWRLARYRATYHAALLAHYGYHVGSRELLDAGLSGLRGALSESWDVR